MDEEVKSSANSESVCKRRKSAESATDADSSSPMDTEVLLEVQLEAPPAAAQALVEAEVEAEADDCCSGSDSPSTPTKNDKSSSDSGVCSKIEEETPSTSCGAKSDEHIDDAVNDVDVQSIATTQDTKTVSKTDKADMDVGIGTADATPVEPTATSVDAIHTQSNRLTREETTPHNVADRRTDVDSDDDVPTPVWYRRARRALRNYRRSSGAASSPDGENADDAAAAGGDNNANIQNISGTAEESQPLLVSSNNAASANAEHQRDVENSPAAHRPGDDASEMSTSQASSQASPYRVSISISSNSSSSLFSDDDDEDDEQEAADNAEQASILADVMNKPKPSYTWNSTYELMRREHGLSGDGRRSLRSSALSGFNTRFYSSRHVVERMKLSHCLVKHNGCVNCLNFNRAGDLLVSGSDDTRIIVWNWAQKKPKIVFKSGHTENIFQTKFINSDGVLDIVSASRDGQVRRSIVHAAGGKPQTSLLYHHHGSVHKIVTSPRNPFEIISAGEDGHIRRKDLRNDDAATSICKVESNNKKRKVRLFSIAHHPFAPQIVVCGCDNFVRVYDKRHMNKTVHQMCPEHLVEIIPQVTCAVYNSTGTEVLASYSDDHIYLFNNVEYKTGEYLHRYRGHYNHKTIKGVNFFGPNSEYIISGSDCGNIFFWDKNTEAIINFMPGDTMGVVNCLEPHPTIPVLATSGLDHNIKIWTPSSDVYPPDLSKLEACVKRNLRRSVVEHGTEFDDHEFQDFIREFLSLPRRPSGNESGNQSSSSSSSDSEENDCPQMEGIQCHTQ